MAQGFDLVGEAYEADGRPSSHQQCLALGLSAEFWGTGDIQLRPRPGPPFPGLRLLKPLASFETSNAIQIVKIIRKSGQIHPGNGDSPEGPILYSGVLFRNISVFVLDLLQEI